MDERDMRDMRGMDGRRLPPRNSRGEFMSRGRGRGRRGDRGMDYGYDMDMARGGRGRDRGMSDYGDMRGGDGRVIRSYPRMDYGDMARGGSRGRGGRGGDYGDMRGGSDYGDMAGRGDGHYMHGGQGMGGYQPIEAMGYFNGYYGMPEQDYGRNRDYGYDMGGGDYARGGRRDYGDYGYEDYGDYGETLSEKELEHWNKKLMEQLDEREKQMFHKDAIMQKIKQMGKPMEGFGEKELYTATLMSYTDDKEFIGQNPDLAIKLGYAFLADKDTKVRGAEKLCVYFDEIVMGGED